MNTILSIRSDSLFMSISGTFSSAARSLKAPLAVLYFTIPSASLVEISRTSCSSFEPAVLYPRVYTVLGGLEGTSECTGCNGISEPVRKHVADWRQTTSATSLQNDYLRFVHPKRGLTKHPSCDLVIVVQVSPKESDLQVLRNRAPRRPPEPTGSMASAIQRLRRCRRGTTFSRKAVRRESRWLPKGCVGYRFCDALGVSSSWRHRHNGARPDVRLSCSRC